MLQISQTQVLIILAHFLRHQRAHITRSSLRPLALAALSPCHGALLNQPPLELRQGSKNVKDHFTRSRCRINTAIIERAKPDSPAFQLLNNIDQVPQRSAKPVKPPDNQGIPIFKLFEASVQARSLSLRAACLVRVNKLLFAAGSFQRNKLQIQFLLKC